MPRNKILINQSELKMFMEAQASIIPNYDVKTYEGQCALAVEQQSADFLEDYLEGTIVLSDDAVTLLPQYFEILKKSKFNRIKLNVEKAVLEHKRKIIENNKQQERIKYWKDTQFNILSKKKEVQKLSSADLLLISKLINETKGYSTSKNKDRLRSIITFRINKTLSGELTADEDFYSLVEKFGSYEQKKKAAQLSTKENNTIVNENTPATSSQKQKKKVELVAVGKDKNIYIPSDQVDRYILRKQFYYV